MDWNYEVSLDELLASESVRRRMRSDGHSAKSVKNLMVEIAESLIGADDGHDATTTSAPDSGR